MPFKFNPLSSRRFDYYSAGNYMAKYRYSSSEVVEDPGAGNFRLDLDGDNLVLSDTDADGNATFWFLFLVLPRESFLMFRQISNPTFFLLMSVDDDPVNEEGYFTLPISPLWGSAEPFADGSEIAFELIYAIEGPAGADGQPGLRWTGEWGALYTYEEGDAVSWGGSSYICIQRSENNEPPNGEYWDVLAQGA